MLAREAVGLSASWERSLIIQPSRLSRKVLLRSNSCGGPAGSGCACVEMEVGEIDIFTPSVANKYDA